LNLNTGLEISRPFILVNMAISADGKIASANRAVNQMGSRRDFEHLLELRATADAVMTGAATLKAQPAITLGPGPERFKKIRRQNGLASAPLRVLVSGTGRLNPKAKIFLTSGTPIIVLTTQRMPRSRRAALAKTGSQIQVCGKSKVDFLAALNWLRTEWGVKRLLCEGGGKLNGSLLAADLVDELHLTVCPLILGGNTAPSIADGPLADHLADAQHFSLKSMTQSGDEVFLVYRVRNRCVQKLDSTTQAN
jgi:riboflavin-specific deaminase-like protein